MKQFSDAVSMLSRDERMVVKISAGRAAARLAAGVHSMLPSECFSISPTKGGGG